MHRFLDGSHFLLPNADLNPSYGKHFTRDYYIEFCYRRKSQWERKRLEKLCLIRVAHGGPHNEQLIWVQIPLR